MKSFTLKDLKKKAVLRNQQELTNVTWNKDSFIGIFNNELHEWDRNGRYLSMSIMKSEKDDPMDIIQII